MSAVPVAGVPADSSVARAERRRLRWSEEARGEWRAFVASSQSQAGTRARLVLGQSKLSDVPEEWAVLASVVAFLLPSHVDCGMVDGKHFGLLAASEFLRRRGCRAAERFATAVAGLCGVMVVDVRGGER